MENELLVYLCDDEAASVRTLTALLKQERDVRTEAFDAGTKLLSAIGKKAPDLVILDIFMRGMDGIAVLREIRAAAGDLPVALCSTSTEFAMDGYRLRAARYLEKPVRPEELHELVTYVRSLRRTQAVFRLGKDETVPLSDILYLEQQDHKIALHLVSGDVKYFYGRLDRLDSLGPAFVRSHKSYLVNLDHVLSIDDELSMFRMRGGGTAYIRKGMIPAMRRLYDDRLIERVRLS